MSFPSARIAIALLLLAWALAACAGEETRSVICHTHKAGNGELTECQ